MSISREILLACALLALAAAARAAAAPAAPSAARGQARLTASALPGRTLSTHDPDLASYDPDAPGDYRPVDEEYDYDYAEGGDETIWCCQNAIEGCTECEERDGDYEEVDYAAEAARAEKVAAAVDDDVTAALEGCAGTAVQGGTGAYFKSDADLGKDPTSNFVRYAQGCAYEVRAAAGPSRARRRGRPPPPPHDSPPRPPPPADRGRHRVPQELQVDLRQGLDVQER